MTRRGKRSWETPRESTIRLISAVRPRDQEPLANLTTRSGRRTSSSPRSTRRKAGSGNVAVVWNVDPFDTANGNVDPFDTKHIDELMVWYVAVTRAQEKLWLGMDPGEGIRFDGDDTLKLVTAISGHHVSEAHPVLKEIREKNAKGYPRFQRRWCLPISSSRWNRWTHAAGNSPRTSGRLVWNPCSRCEGHRPQRYHFETHPNDDPVDERDGIGGEDG